MSPSRKPTRREEIGFALDRHTVALDVRSSL